MVFSFVNNKNLYLVHLYGGTTYLQQPRVWICFVLQFYPDISACEKGSKPWALCVAAVHDEKC